MPAAKTTRRSAWKLGVGPELGIQLYYGLISTMIELDVFRECATEPRTADDLARAAGVSQHAVFGQLLDLLA